MNQDQVWNKWPYFKFKEVGLASKYRRWLGVAKTLKLSSKVILRLKWIIYYYTKANNNVSLTCRYFNISRKTFYKWLNRFNETNLSSLENESKAPLHVRQKEYTPLQYERIVLLRKKYIRYGKFKLLGKYQRLYPTDKDISSWKIQSIIQIAGIYYRPAKNSRIQAKRRRAQVKKRITELKKKPRNGFLICLDSIIKYWNGQKRYIITAIDTYAKVAYARMYNSHSSLATKDFLYRLNYLLDNNIENIQTDNGSEFQKHFQTACQELNIKQYYSRVRTPKDNAVCERFNRTLNEEFIQLGNMTTDLNIFNQRLTEWLIEYNFERPHQSLDYLTPIEFTQKYTKVLPMWSSSTFPCYFFIIMLI